MEGRGKMESGVKNDERERRKWIGGREGKRKGFPEQCQSASYAPATHFSD